MVYISAGGPKPTSVQKLGYGPVPQTGTATGANPSLLRTPSGNDTFNMRGVLGSLSDPSLFDLADKAGHKGQSDQKIDQEDMMGLINLAKQAQDGTIDKSKYSNEDIAKLKALVAQAGGIDKLAQNSPQLFDVDTNQDGLELSEIQNAANQLNTTAQPVSDQSGSPSTGTSPGGTSPEGSDASGENPTSANPSDSSPSSPDSLPATEPTSDTSSTQDNPFRSVLNGLAQNDKLFQEADSDRDGNLTKDEINRFLTKLNSTDTNKLSPEKQKLIDSIGGKNALEPLINKTDMLDSNQFKKFDTDGTTGFSKSEINTMIKTK